MLDVRKEAVGGWEVGVEMPQQFFNYKDNGALDSGWRGKRASINEILKT